MKGLNKLKKCWKQLILALTMIFSISTASLSQINAEMVKLEKGEAIRYPSWLGNWSTNYYYINGQLSYCLNSSRNEPVNNDSAVAEIHENEALLKVLYYGFGGPGDVFRDDQVTNDTTKYLYTHIMASYAYSGDIYGGKSWEDLEAHGVGLKTRYDQIQSMPVPKTEFNLNGTRNLNLKAYYENNYQRTENIQFNSSVNNTITIPLYNGIELHNITKNTVSSNSAVINGGDIFYLQAKLNVRDNYSSGKLTGSAKTRYAPLIIKSDNTSVQDIGSLSFTYDPVDLIFGIEWADVGSLELTKTNDTGELLNGSEFNLKHTTLEFEKDLVVKNGKIKADNLPVGDYILTETKVPDGHAAIQKTFKVTINKDQTTERIVVNNIRPTGTLEINKTLENSNVEVNKADYDLTKVQFKITASQDVYDSVSLEKLYSKGDVITVGSGKGSNEDTVKLISGNELGNGIYTCDKNGKLALSGLPMGTYNVEEIACPDGFVLDKEVKTVQFAQQDFVTLTYTSSLNINNELTKTVFSKVTADGDNLYGVPMEIVDVKTGKPVHTWISDDNYLEIDGLPVGDYQWREVNAPEGYVLAKPIEFTVKDGDIQDIEMKNFSVEFAKNGNDGNKLLKGGEFQVTSTTKQIVDKWTSGEHIFDVTEDMKAKLMAGETVSDMYVEIEDDSSIYYRISKNEGRDDYRLLMQANGETKYYNIDINGDETTHMIRGTAEDQEYVITELKSPDGYATAKPVTFKTNKEQNLTVEMTDEITKLEFYKKDITSQEELEGATLQIKDKNGNIVDEWVSEKTPHKITGLTVGQTYTMIEVIAPANYKIAQNKEFTVSDTGKVQKITMYDELMPVAKKVKTADDMYIGMYMILGGLSALSIGMFMSNRNKKNA